MTGTPARTMGNGEGFTTLILTDAESRLIRSVLEAGEREERRFDAQQGQASRADAMRGRPAIMATAAYNAGIQRAMDRIKAEFEAEQKARKAGR